MTESLNFPAVFKSLKKILLPYAKKLVLKCDLVDEFHVDTKLVMKNKKPMYFGSVKINKNYVSFHLMPIYVFPHLLDDMSPELKHRMQGKSCFNFKSIDSILFQELTELAEKGYIEYKKSNYL